MLITLKAPQPSLRSFLSFLGLSLLVAILFILTGAYGSLLSILLTSVTSAGVAWMVWVLIKSFKISRIGSSRLRYILSGGLFSLLLLSNIHHPVIEQYFVNLAELIDVPARMLQNPLAFILGALLGLMIYLFNSRLK
ncbi:hypothetical protein [Neptunicella sp.]|uniref:hypothetical protein n=1 Tax=Neptunicella sp. TaxID=2125986 RepID=UPI003F68EA5F